MGGNGNNPNLFELTLDIWGPLESHQEGHKYSCYIFQNMKQILHSYCPHPPENKQFVVITDNSYCE